MTKYHNRAAVAFALDSRYVLSWDEIVDMFDDYSYMLDDIVLDSDDKVEDIADRMYNSHNGYNR